MGKNSIYENLTIDSIINEIRLTLSAKACTPFLIVEGDEDIDFFQQYCSQGVIIRESFAGKSGVYQIVDFFKNENSVIGICDRDYDNAQLPIHIFCYDHSCLESMLFANTETAEIIFIQLALKNNISLERILTQLLRLSLFRKMNFVHNLGIRFDGLHISKVFDCSCGIKKDILITELEKINNGVLPLTNEQKESIEANINSRYTIYGLLAITQGHDLINLVQCYHAHYVSSKSKTMRESAIRLALYCAYVGKFNTSKLYSDVLQYGQDVNVNFWMR